MERPTIMTIIITIDRARVLSPDRRVVGGRRRSGFVSESAFEKLRAGNYHDDDDDEEESTPY